MVTYKLILHIFFKFVAKMLYLKKQIGTYLTIWLNEYLSY